MAGWSSNNDNDPVKGWTYWRWEQVADMTDRAAGLDPLTSTELDEQVPAVSPFFRGAVVLLIIMTLATLVALYAAGH